MKIHCFVQLNENFKAVNTKENYCWWRESNVLFKSTMSFVGIIYSKLRFWELKHSQNTTLMWEFTKKAWLDELSKAARFANDKSTTLWPRFCFLREVYCANAKQHKPQFIAIDLCFNSGKLAENSYRYLHFPLAHDRDSQGISIKIFYEMQAKWGQECQNNKEYFWPVFCFFCAYFT